MTTRTLYDGDTFEYRGHTFRVTMERDDCISEPWKEYDGHGPVSEWVTRAKGPGERILATDRCHHRFYDFAEAIKIAKHDQWRCQHGRTDHATVGELAHCAVEQDYDRLHRWCQDDWCYVVLTVKLLDDDGNETIEDETIGGVESDSGDYMVTLAHELADEILSRVEVDEPNVHLSEN